MIDFQTAELRPAAFNMGSGGSPTTISVTVPGLVTKRRIYAYMALTADWMTANIICTYRNNAVGTFPVFAGNPAQMTLQKSYPWLVMASPTPVVGSLAVWMDYTSLIPTSGGTQILLPLEIDDVIDSVQLKFDPCYTAYDGCYARAFMAVLSQGTPIPPPPNLSATSGPNQ